MVAAGNEKMDAEGSFPARSGWGITIGSYEEEGEKPEKKPNLGEKDPLITDENDPDLSFTTKPTYNKDSFIHSWFSNYGKRLDFVAPGKYIRSAWAPYPNNRAFDPEKNDHVPVPPETVETVSSGTSMSTPYMAAAAAYIKLLHPEYHQSQIYSTFMDYTRDLGAPGKDNLFGHGYVNMAKILLPD